MKPNETKRTRDVWNWFNRELAGYYPEREAHAIAAEVFKRLFDLPPDKRVLHANQTFTPPMLFRSQKALSALMERIPVQYVTGVCSFLDAEIRVTSDVLIPRPETEELVLWAASAIREELQSVDRDFSILDIGTGSGCIAIALARRYPSATVHACDISTSALKIAKRNARLNGTKVLFYRMDVLDPESAPCQQADCIVSNPPYVRMQEKIHMNVNVLDYEPGQALFVPDEDPLQFYRAIARKEWLNPGGLLFLEINEAMGEGVMQLLGEKGFEWIGLKRDFRGKPRFVRARKPRI
mgnify:CR=1 FL=1